MGKKKAPTVGYWLNLGDGSWKRKARWLTRKAKKGADLFMLCEAFDRYNDLARWAEKHGYELYGPGAIPGSKETVALVRVGAPSVVRDTRVLSPTRKVGPGGAGPSTQGAKAIQIVGVRGVRIIGAHFVPSFGASAKRRTLHGDQMRNLVDAVEAWEARGPVIVLSDFNAKPHDAVMADLRATGLTQKVHKPTHGKRWQPDQCWTSIPGRVKAKVVRAPSDHKAIRVTVSAA